MQPELLEDGQICVDMGSPILEAEAVPTTLPPTQVGCQLCFSYQNASLPTWSWLKFSTMSKTHNSKSCSILQDGAAVKAPLEVDGKTWLMTCVSMGNPHAVTFGTADGQGIKARCSTCRCVQHCPLVLHFLLLLPKKSQASKIGSHPINDFNDNVGGRVGHLHPWA